MSEASMARRPCSTVTNCWAGGNIKVQGSDIDAGGTARLIASQGQIELLAAANTHQESNSSQSRSGSVGVSVGMSGGKVGVSVNASASRASGNGQGSGTTYTNTHVKAGQGVVLESGGDTTLKGAVITAPKVSGQIGGDLHIESLQDTAVYNETGKSSGFSLNVPITGVGKAGGSISSGKTNINSNYQSVTEQSGIKTGDGGFQIDVAGSTTLKGGVISSTQAAVDAGKNSLVTSSLITSDLQNTAQASAESSGFALSTDMFSQGKYGMVKGALSNALTDADEAAQGSGLTRSAVSGGTIQITDEAQQRELTRQSAQETIASLNRDVNQAHQAAPVFDAKAMKQEVQDRQTVKQELFKQGTAATTDLVYRQQTADKKIILQKCDANGESCTRTQVASSDVVVSNGKVCVFNNGIMNDEEQALANARVQSSSDANEQGVYVIINPYTGNPVAEVISAGWDKLNEVLGGALPISTASEANIDIRQSAGKQGGVVIDVSHSRGTLTSSNATAEQVRNGEANAAIGGVILHGGAANANNTANLVNQATSGTGQVYQSTHKDDLVGTVIGGNPPTGGVDSPLDTAHGIYGPGHSTDEKSSVWGSKDGSITVPIAPRSTMEVRP